MPKTQDTLKKIVETVGGRVIKISGNKPTKDQFYNSDYHLEIKSVYCDLSSNWEEYPTGYRGYDIVLDDGTIIELDEEQHFNHYRKNTLSSPLYRLIEKTFSPNYTSYCGDQFEKECLNKSKSRAKYWSSSSSEKQFGVSNTFGKFEDGGSSRWKQRAFYDFLRDASQLITRNRLVRVSYWDKIVYKEKEKTVQEILKNEKKLWYKSLWDYIENLINPIQFSFDYDTNDVRRIKDYFKSEDPDVKEYHPIGHIIPLDDQTIVLFNNDKKINSYNDIEYHSYKSEDINKLVRDLGWSNAIEVLNYILFIFLREYSNKARYAGNDNLNNKWQLGLNRFTDLNAVKVQPTNIEIVDSEFRTLIHSGIEYHFTLKQSKLIKYMYDEQVLEGKVDFDQLELLMEVDSDQYRLRDLFKSGGTIHNCWNQLIVFTKAGRYKLNI